MLEQQLRDRVPLAAPAVDRAPLRVLESANMPAVLIEMGYLTNPDQERQLAADEFQNTLVQAIYDAVVRFRDYAHGRRRRDDGRPRARDRRRGASLVAVLVARCCSSWLPRWTARATTTTPAARRAAPAAPAAPGRKIKARLFYVAEDGTQLTSVERDVAYGEGPVEQAREIIAAQIAPVAEPLVSAVPPGTTLRARVHHRRRRGLRRSEPRASSRRIPAAR